MQPRRYWLRGLLYPFGREQPFPTPDNANPPKLSVAMRGYSLLKGVTIVSSPVKRTRNS